MNKTLSNFIVLEETFMQGQYAWLVEKLRPGTTAIDIGANIGDSAIYLAMQPSIKKIYAYEPYPYLYNQGNKYVRESIFKKKIFLKNAGISSRHGFISVPGRAGNVDSKLKDFGHGKKIPVYPLNAILAQRKNVILKCDAEGSEHEIFTAETNLENVYRMQIEYHHGTRELPSIFKKKGFKVKTKKNSRLLGIHGEVGWIWATK